MLLSPRKFEVITNVSPAIIPSYSLKVIASVWTSNISVTTIPASDTPPTLT